MLYRESLELRCRGEERAPPSSIMLKLKIMSQESPKTLSDLTHSHPPDTCSHNGMKQLQEATCLNWLPAGNKGPGQRATQCSPPPLIPDLPITHHGARSPGETHWTSWSPQCQLKRKGEEIRKRLWVDLSCGWLLFCDTWPGGKGA